MPGDAVIKQRMPKDGSSKCKPQEMYLLSNAVLPLLQIISKVNVPGKQTHLDPGLVPQTFKLLERRDYLMLSAYIFFES